METSQFRPDSRTDRSPMVYVVNPQGFDNNLVVSISGGQLREIPLEEFLKQNTHPSDRRQFMDEFPGKEGFYDRRNLQLLADAVGQPVRMFFDCDKGKVDFWELPLELMINDKFFHESSRTERRMGGLLRREIPSCDVVAISLPTPNRLMALGLEYARR